MRQLKNFLKPYTRDKTGNRLEGIIIMAMNNKNFSGDRTKHSRFGIVFIFYVITDERDK